VTFRNGILRRFLCLPCLFFSLSVLQAQSPNEDKPTDSYIFPLALVLEWAEYASEGWMPDWPLEIPPDAFKVLSGEISFCEIAYDDFTLGLKIDDAGRAEIFPLMLNGEIAQAALVYNELSQMQEIAITFPSGDDPWKLEFLEYRNTFPYLVRAYCGGTESGDGDAAGVWYFIYYSWGVSEILETWYDENGTAVGIYGFALVEVGRKPRIRAVKDYSDPENGTELFYDSRRLVTGVSEPAGIFNVLYFRENSPRYWERHPANAAGENVAGNNLVAAGNFTFQWDEAGLLMRLSGEDESSGQLLDCRYEYTLDDMGNWVERRETRRIRDLGFLVPAPGTTIRRILEYKK